MLRPAQGLPGGYRRRVADVVALEADLDGITGAHVVARGGLLAVHTEDGSHACRLGATSERIEPCEDEQVWLTRLANGEVSGFTSPGPGAFVLTTRGGERAGTILRSTDEGLWQHAAADLVRWTWVAAGGGDRVYGLAEDSVGFLESTDGGVTWRTQVLAP
ncbi:hypothetical protein JNO54_08760 [Janibacter sp. YIM B02568]|uniref:hypothetical protein n=1 Tax=Janibacter endophyticus TaxID=2806261 RepID=UPI00194DE917|nr:hypothetical protein [Janibacter endophyticus]MBM6546230.1 hypothetical protein [Janibacter endophyticus]